MIKQKVLLLLWVLLFTVSAEATWYNIQNTKFYVNGLPADLTEKERLKLLEVNTQEQTESNCKPDCDVLNKAATKLKIQQIIKAEAVATVPQMLTPRVDILKEMKSAVGYNNIRIAPTAEIAPASGGEFRIACLPSHMSNDDPLVFPNQEGAAHHHTFFGNTSVNYKSDLNSFGRVGNSSCAGGIMNRSAYWVPSMINTENSEPIAPNGNVLVYYKSGAIDGKLIKAPPKGLRMIAGDMTKKDNSYYSHTGFTCHPGVNSRRSTWPRIQEIPTGANCEAGDDLMLSVFFPQCWDGKNLDSPNHKDHMAYASHRVDKLPHFYCPATHPIAIPEITVNVHYTILPNDNLTKWRLSSDNYPFNGKNAGYSAHSDYVEGWDRPILEGIIKNCINAKKDCHAHLLGDGRSFY